MKSVYLEKLKYLNPFNMSNFNFNDCLKAMNKAQFRPTEYRKAKALELLWEAIEYVENLEVKSAKPKVICSDQLGKELSVDYNADGSRTYNFGKPKSGEQLFKELGWSSEKSDSPKPQRKASPKRSKAKVKRATPQQRVADKQEKLFHGKADSPVQPSKKAKKASVAKARKSAAQVSEATGATARAKAKQLAKAKAEAKELQKQLAATMEKLASLL